MNTISGELIELFIENGTTKGKVRIDGSALIVPMFLMLDAKLGDTVLIESGVAVSIFHQEGESEYVLSHPRQSALN